jgi:uncharacterized membrane protein
MGSILLLAAIVGLFVLYNREREWKRESFERLQHLQQVVGQLLVRVHELERKALASRAATPEATATAPAEPVAVRVPPATPSSVAEPAAVADAITREAAPAAEAPAARAWPPAPAPSIATRLPQWLQWCMGGNTLVRTGVIVLFFGVAFLLKFVAERYTFPIEARLGGAAVGGLGLVLLGWRLRERRPGYALSLQGGGIGIFYITIYAAFRLYGLLPPTAAFALMLAIVAVSGALAVRQDALALAMLGTTGGFLAPILASTGSGNLPLLLGYFVVLNLGVLGLALAKTWRPLNLLGFAFTFLLQLLWVTNAYRPEHLWSTGPFLIAFFVQYLGIAVLYARHRSIALQHYVDGTIVFGTPLVVFGLLAPLLRDMEHGLAGAAVLFAAIYLGLAVALRQRSVHPSMRLLSDAFLAIGACFGTLAIPLYFDARATSALWAIEGAAIVWVATRQQQRLARWFGVALQGLAAIAFSWHWEEPPARMPLLNSTCFGFLLLALAAGFTARQLATLREKGLTRYVSDGLYLLGYVYLVAGGAHEIDDFVPRSYVPAALIGLAAVTTAASTQLRRALDWEIAQVPPLLLLPALYVLAFVQLAGYGLVHPAARGGAVAWPAAFAVLLWFLRRHEDDGALMRRLAPGLHVGAVGLVTLLATIEARWAVAQVFADAATWRIVAGLSVPALVLFLLTEQSATSRWPLGIHGRMHLRITAPLLVGGLWLGMILANVVSDGGTALPVYVPILNPLELASLFVLWTLLRWHRTALAAGVGSVPPDTPFRAAAALGFSGFVLANAALLRTLHHWVGTPFATPAMWHSQIVQTALTVFWSILAVTVMFLAARRTQRLAWIAGALLLGVVVLKLFLFDLSQLRGLGRIVAFLGVGVLLLAIGYFSPVPPKEKPAAAD